ncbi:MAG TPA: metallophosphoesterase [Anaeromyxobacter sp.]
MEDPHGMTRFSRRRFLQGAAWIGAAGATGGLPALAAARDDSPRTERVSFRIPGLDPAHDGLRLAQLSDLHFGPRTPLALIRAALDEANRFEPDLVVLTGDYLTRRREDVRTLREHIGGLRAPTVAVLGNHDVWVDPAGAAAALRRHGYEVLENAWTTLSLRGVPFRIVGIGDHLTHRDDVLAAVRGLPSRAATPLVLAHGPRTADKLAALGRPALCLSGNTHGGQVNLPIVTPILLASLREPYARGLYQLGPVQLYVNRGVGNSGISFRLNSPPEVTLATLRRVEPGEAPGPRLQATGAERRSSRVL